MSTLTRFPEGSLRELGVVSLPLMISIFASLCMIFTDRLFLAHYSLNALNAAVNAGTLAWAMMGGIGMVTAMSEVFVAQYNGAKEYKKIGSPVWQMIWLALFSYALFLPLAYFAPVFFAADPNAQLATEYYRTLMYFGPSYALMNALAGFFIGRGRTKILVLSALVANISNTLLDWLLIFGYPPYIPEMGLKGAAIATCLGYVFQIAILSFIVFRAQNRREFNTLDARFDAALFRNCAKVGFPQGIFYGLEVFGWAMFYWMMSSLSKTHITISGICQSLFILFSFFHDGLSRGIVAIAGNAIGAGRSGSLLNIMRSGLILQAMFSVVVACLILIDSQTIIGLLFFNEGFSAHASHNMGLESNMMAALQICLIYCFASLFLEGARWVFSGLLTAAGDTFFLMIGGSLSVWIGLILPIYAIVVRHHLPVSTAWLIGCAYTLLLCIIYALRFKRGAWRSIRLIKQDEAGN